MGAGEGVRRKNLNSSFLAQTGQKTSCFVKLPKLVKMTVFDPGFNLGSKIIKFIGLQRFS